MELTTAMMADGAHVANGKLYVLGGQWDRLGAVSFPTQHPAMALVLVIKVEYNEAMAPHTFEALLTIDGRAQGINATGQLTTGHAPGLALGAPTFVPMALPFNNVTFDGPGRYEWMISVDGNELGRVPIDVFPLHVMGTPPGVVPTQPEA
jgi:hypothetical protein